MALRCFCRARPTLYVCARSEQANATTSKDTCTVFRRSKRETQRVHHRISRLQGSSIREMPSALAGRVADFGPHTERKRTCGDTTRIVASNPSPTNREEAVQRTESVAPTPSADTVEHDLSGGFCGSFAAAAHEVAAEVVRRELPYFFRIALPAQLVRSLESEVVCGLFTNDLSAFAAAVVGVDLAAHRIGYGLYGGSVRRHSASGIGCLSVCVALGRPPRRLRSRLWPVFFSARRAF